MKAPEELKGYDARQEQCVGILLDGIPCEGGITTRESLAALIRTAFRGGFILGLHVPEEEKE